MKAKYIGDEGWIKMTYGKIYDIELVLTLSCQYKDDEGVMCMASRKFFKIDFRKQKLERILNETI